MSHTHVSEVIHAFNLAENAGNGLANMRGNSLIMNFGKSPRKTPRVRMRVSAAVYRRLSSSASSMIPAYPALEDVSTPSVCTSAPRKTLIAVLSNRLSSAYSGLGVLGPALQEPRAAAPFCVSPAPGAQQRTAARGSRAWACDHSANSREATLRRRNYDLK
jgi:hypothetical protein